MDLSKIKVLCEGRPGGIRGVAFEVGMSEQNMHRCIRANKIMANDLERISAILGVSPLTFFDENPAPLVNLPTRSVESLKDERIRSLQREVDDLRQTIKDKERIIELLSK